MAIGLARLETAVTWLGRVGDDSLGRRVARELRAEGVEVVAIVDDGAPTGLLLKETPSPGRTVITSTVRAARAAVSSRPILTHWISRRATSCT